MTENDAAFERYIKQAQADTEAGQWHYAIANYQRALATHPNQHVWLYQALGQLLCQVDQVDDALSCYRKAQAIAPDDAMTYALVGQAVAKKGLISDAIASYGKAIALAPQPAWVHKEIGDLLSKRAANDYVHSAISYIQVMQAQDQFHCYKLLQKTLAKAPELSALPPAKQLQILRLGYKRRPAEDFAFPQRLATLGFLQLSDSPVSPSSYYFVNEQLKTIYCSIPKNACTLFKTMLVNHSDLETEFKVSQQNIHVFLSQKTATASADALLERLDSPEYYKFTVLRNPFHRIVSGYLDKFAKHPVPESFAQAVVKSVQTSLGLALDIEKSITFRQFVDYLVSTPDDQLNDHWRPQHNFMAAVKFDLIGQFEKLDEVIASLENALGVQVQRNVSKHATKYKQFSERADFCDWYPLELRALDGMPQAHQLFSKDLKIKIQLRYQQDIALYEKVFERDANSLDANTGKN